MLPARCADVIYFGDHLRLLCAMGDGQADATVKLSLSVPHVPETGDRVRLEFPTEFTRIYA